MGLMETIRKAIRGTRDPRTELERQAKEAEVEAMRRDEAMKVRMPPGNDRR